MLKVTRCVNSGVPTHLVKLLLDRSDVTLFNFSVTFNSDFLSVFRIFFPAFPSKT